jgi:hypothetical protein
MFNVVKLSVAMLNVIILKVVMLNVIILKVVMLNVIILIVFMLSVIMLSVIMLSVVMLSVVAPLRQRKREKSEKSECLREFLKLFPGIENKSGKKLENLIILFSK